MKPFNIFFIPYWIYETLKAQGINLSIIVNYSEVKKFLSQEDLIELLAFQGINLIHASADKFRGSTLHSVGLIDNWVNTDNNESSLELQNLTKIGLEQSNNPGYMQSLNQRLDKLDTLVSEKLYEVIDLKGENIGLIINRGFKQITAKEFYVMVQAILRILYMYEPTVKVVNRPIFKLYVELMMRNRVTG